MWSPYEGDYYEAGRQDRRFIIEEGGDYRVEMFGPDVDPDQHRSTAARAAFLECLAERMGANVRISLAQMWVSEDGELISLFYRARRPGGSPPIAVVPDLDRTQCLAEAGVSTDHLDGSG